MLTLDQLRDLIHLCREEGVAQLSSPEVSFVLGPKPPPIVTGETNPPPSDEEKLEQELFNQG